MQVSWADMQSGHSIMHHEHEHALALLPVGITCNCCSAMLRLCSCGHRAYSIHMHRGGSCLPRVSCCSCTMHCLCTRAETHARLLLSVRTALRAAKLQCYAQHRKRMPAQEQRPHHRASHSAMQAASGRSTSGRGLGTGPKLAWASPRSPKAGAVAEVVMVVEDLDGASCHMQVARPLPFALTHSAAVTDSSMVGSSPVLKAAPSISGNSGIPVERQQNHHAVQRKLTPPTKASPEARLIGADTASRTNYASASPPPKRGVLLHPKDFSTRPCRPDFASKSSASHSLRKSHMVAASAACSSGSGIQATTSIGYGPGRYSPSQRSTHQTSPNVSSDGMHAACMLPARQLQILDGGKAVLTNSDGPVTVMDACCGVVLAASQEPHLHILRYHVRHVRQMCRPCS